MPANFQDLPYDVMINIFSKLDIASLSKMRRTSSFVQNVMEKYRHHIQARSDGLPAILKICVDKEKMSLVSKVAYKALTEEEHEKLSYHLGKIDDEEWSLIENPFVQLSAVKFDYILLDFYFDLVDKPAVKRRENLDSQADVAKQVLPLLDQLRLDCDWLCLTLTCRNAEITPKVLSKIFFKNFFFSGPCTYNDVKQWPIQNCEELHIGCLKDVPDRISPMIKTLRNGSLMFETEKSVAKMIQNFLMEVKEDRSARGNIQKFSVVAIGVEELANIEGLEIIWEGENECDEEMIVYRMKIEGGFTYIKLWQDSYDITFLEEECDEEMIDNFTCCRCENPCDYF